jgi:hypothetical protein
VKQTHTITQLKNAKQKKKRATHTVYMYQIEAVGGDKEVENVQRIYTQKKISLKSDE